MWRWRCRPNLVVVLCELLTHDEHDPPCPVRLAEASPHDVLGEAVPDGHQVGLVPVGLLEHNDVMLGDEARQDLLGLADPPGLLLRPVRRAEQGVTIPHHDAASRRERSPRTSNNSERVRFTSRSPAHRRGSLQVEFLMSLMWAPARGQESVHHVIVSRPVCLKTWVANSFGTESAG